MYAWPPNLRRPMYGTTGTNCNIIAISDIRLVKVCSTDLDHLKLKWIDLLIALNIREISPSN